jgi:hypothetical protein
MALADEPVTASMDPWLVVDVGGEPSLFGFARWHPNTGGLSWLMSTEIVELDEARGRARTQSGRVYQLGRRIEPGALDDEGRLALRLMLARWIEQAEPPDEDLHWLTARKMARHLNLSPPPRDDRGAVEEFLTAHHERYLAHRSRLRGS